MPCPFSREGWEAPGTLDRYHDRRREIGGGLGYVRRGMSRAGGLVDANWIIEEAVRAVG